MATTIGMSGSQLLRGLIQLIGELQDYRRTPQRRYKSKNRFDSIIFVTSSYREFFLCAAGRHSRPFRSLAMIPGVLDISWSQFTRSYYQKNIYLESYLNYLISTRCVHRDSIQGQMVGGCKRGVKWVSLGANVLHVKHCTAQIGPVHDAYQV